MTIFLKDKITYKEAKEAEKVKEKILEMIVLHLPERHIRDYIQATRLYYDYNYQESKVGFPLKDNEKEVKRLPLVLNLEFNAKKISMKTLWVEIIEKLDSKFKDNFEVIEYKEFSEFSKISEEGKENPQLILRLLERGMSESEKKEDKRDNETVFTYINRMENDIKGLSVGGIPGIKTVKTSKKFIMSASEESKTNLTDKEK